MDNTNREYKIRVRLIDGKEINSRISNSSNPIAALISFLSNNENAKIELIQFLEIVDVENNQIMQTTESIQQIYLH